MEAGRLAVRQEGRQRKFRAQVHEKTFAGASGGCRVPGRGWPAGSAQPPPIRTSCKHPPTADRCLRPAPPAWPAAANGRTVLYITERAVFRLVVQPPAGTTAGGGGRGQACQPTLELIEVAPGIDVERDVLAHMDFRPLVRGVRLMPAEIFKNSF